MWKPISYADTQRAWYWGGSDHVYVYNYGGIFKINQLATVTNQRRLDSSVKKIKKSI